VWLWSVWRGPFGLFCDSLAGHGIYMSRALVRNILHVSGRRLSKRRRGANPDAEAIRGEVDTATAAHLGFSLRDREGSRGLLAAYGQAAGSTKGTPLGFLRDAKPCNHSEAVEAQLNEDGVISMVRTVGRPQNNSPVENSFSTGSEALSWPSWPESWCPWPHSPDRSVVPRTARLQHRLCGTISQRRTAIHRAYRRLLMHTD